MRNKICSKCKIDFPLDHFYTYWCSERNKHRVHSKCYRCANKARVQTAKRKREDGTTSRGRYERRPRRRFLSAIGLADRRGLGWTLSYDQYYCLIKCPCYYCGGKLNETRIGLDRLDNTLGYTLHNSVPCCSDCNRIKCHLLTSAEMLEVAKVLKRMRK